MIQKAISLFFVFALIPTLALAKKGDPAKCAQRVRQHCYLSNNDFERIEDNVESCKQVNSRNGDQLEVFQLREAGKLVVVDTSPRSGQYCTTTKYTIDFSGIQNMKVISGKIFLLSNSGRVYVMLSDEEVYEMLNAKGRSYSNVTDIKGDDSGTAIRLIGPGFDNAFTMNDIIDKAFRGQLRKLVFFHTNTSRSLFRDE